jgi:hypothetical protein
MLGTTLEYLALIVLPAVILAILVPPAWLIAAPLLALPLMVGTVAGFQANISKSHRHWWSRPLVGLLSVLQPVCRGMMRYRTRMALAPAGRPPAVTAEDLPLVSLPESNTIQVFWAPTHVDRPGLLGAIATEATRHGFQIRQDSGWYDFDLELTGDAWARFKLITAVEELEKGESNFRCRLELRWSFLANLLFFGASVFVALVIWLVAGWQPWVWMLPATLPLLLWVIEARQLVTASIIVGLVGVVTDRCGMKPFSSLESFK